jgi:hypothetical protein
MRLMIALNFEEISKARSDSVNRISNGRAGGAELQKYHVKMGCLSLNARNDVGKFYARKFEE